jgi:hypothetical protein
MPRITSGVKTESIKQWEENGVADRYGVDSLTLVEEIPPEKFPELLRPSGSVHPRFPKMAVSKRTWTVAASGFYRVTYQYEGVLLELPEATYDLQGSLSENPIQTHPDFVSVLAGKPSKPKNGAIFVNRKTGDPSMVDSPGVAEFKEFSATVKDPEDENKQIKNKKAGIEAYLVPGATWTKTSILDARPTALSKLGEIQEPDGPNPTLGDRTWLFYDVSYQKRGFIYQLKETWKLSDRGGWDAEVYPGDAD